MTVSLPGIPAAIGNLIQENTLERVFHDALYPRLLFRSEAMPEMWSANIGERKLFTRAGLINVDTSPLVQSQDPSPASFGYEQWTAEARQFGNTIDTHMPTSYVSLAPIFMRNTVQLGLNAGETLNQLARNSLYRAYLGGNTNLAATAASGSTTLEVASLNGFTEVVNGEQARPLPVSPANPLSATLSSSGNTETVSIVGAVPNDPAEPFGRGVLTLAAATTNAHTLADPRPVLLADNRSRITRVGGGTSVDAITASNVLTLQDIINAVARLRAARVPTCADGTYHVHLSPEAEAQIFQDNQFQRLHQSLPEQMAYRDLAIARLVGCTFYRNTEVPNRINSGTLAASGEDAQTSSDVGGDIVNAAGLGVARTIVIGGGAIYENYLDESKFITEAGTTGKIGNFNVVNNGVQVMTERIRFILRAPLDRLQQVVAQSWSWSGDFPVPSDTLTFDGARFKRAVVIEHVGA